LNATRSVQPERLDALPAAHPDAIRARRDLRRVHRVLGTRRILLAALRAMHPRREPGMPIRILELGAGDGTLMLGVARGLGPDWAPVELVLLDRLSLVDASTIDGFRQCGWTARPIVHDVVEWAREIDARRERGTVEARHDFVLATLFLHHFEPPALSSVLRAGAAVAQCFIACEPRRGRMALAGSRLIGVIGVDSVTREDAVTSVHAGFRGQELSEAWACVGGTWMLDEYRAGPFSHVFRARRTANDPEAPHDAP
jgi:hypothetical protein